MAVVILTDKVQEGGFRILPKGINLARYKKNPILLFMHARARAYEGFDEKQVRLPVARMENPRVEKLQDGSMALVTDDPIWDEKDGFAIILKNKYEGGFLNGFSAGLDPVESSGDAKYLLEGQTRLTLVESMLEEISIVDIPHDMDGGIRLSNNKATKDYFKLLKLQKEKPVQLNAEFLKVLELPKETDNSEVLEAIKDLKNYNNKLKKNLKKSKKEIVELVLNNAVDTGKINETQIANYRKLLMSNFEETKTIIDKISASNTTLSIASLINRSKEINKKEKTKLSIKDRSKWTLLDYRKHAPEELERNPELLGRLTMDMK